MDGIYREKVVAHVITLIAPDFKSLPDGAISESAAKMISQKIARAIDLVEKVYEEMGRRLSSPDSGSNSSSLAL